MQGKEISVGIKEVSVAMVGEMGIKSVFVGREKIYERPGAYVYIKISGSEGE